MTPSRRILVVEDEPGILDVYRDILVPKGRGGSIKSSRTSAKESSQGDYDHFELTLVPTGEQAVAAVKQSVDENKPFAMGFFDVLLGTGIDGIETVKRIHDLDKEMYTVLVTAYQDRHVNAIGSLFGKEYQDRWDYLNKPFSEGEILQKARNMVSMWNIRKSEKENQARLDDLKGKMAENEKNLAIAAVARSVGHEFGNILLQIMGRADLSRNGSEDTMRKGLDTILLATEHASKVLERFKNLARSNGNHDRSQIDLSDPLQEALLLIDHELKRQKVDVKMEINEPLPVLGSRTALMQVFMNFFINALHALKSKGGVIEIKGQVVNKNVELTFKDSGSGIPEEHLPKIFEPFFTTKGEKGTGLGLSICKEIIEIVHDGRLTVSNHASGGAVFLVTIPKE